LRMLDGAVVIWYNYAVLCGITFWDAPEECLIRVAALAAVAARVWFLEEAFVLYTG
jgi:hypothetical protein